MDTANESNNPTQSTLENQNGVTPVVVRREPEKDLFVWRAPSRPFKRRPREFYVTLFAIVGLLGLVLFIAEGAMPVILLIAIVFLFYILSTVEPTEIEYKITNKGIKIGGVTTSWQIMSRFCFVKKAESEVLTIETFTIPERMEVMVNLEDIETVRKYLLDYIPEDEIKPSRLEKITNWFSSKLPGNK